MHVCAVIMLSSSLLLYLGTLLGSVQWKRASSRGEAGTSGFLLVSDSDCTVPAVLGQDINRSHGVPSTHRQLLLFSQSHSNLKPQGQLLGWFSHHRKKGSNFLAPASIRRSHRATGATVRCFVEWRRTCASGAGVQRPRAIPPAAPCEASCGPWRHFYL